MCGGFDWRREISGARKQGRRRHNSVPWLEQNDVYGKHGVRILRRLTAKEVGLRARRSLSVFAASLCAMHNQPTKRASFFRRWLWPLFGAFAGRPVVDEQLGRGRGCRHRAPGFV